VPRSICNNWKGLNFLLCLVFKLLHALKMGLFSYHVFSQFIFSFLNIKILFKSLQFENKSVIQIPKIQGDFCILFFLISNIFLKSRVDLVKWRILGKSTSKNIFYVKFMKKKFRLDEILKRFFFRPNNNRKIEKSVL
jgi:hypothetical protein